MRAADLFQKYRRSINPPYRRKDILAVLGTVLILLAIPLTVISLKQARELRPKAKVPIEVAEETLVKSETLEMLKLNRQLKRDPSKKTNLEKQIAGIAKARKEKIFTLIEQNPQFVLRIALSEQLRSSLPALVQDEVEVQTVLAGTLEVLHTDDFARQISQYFYFLETPEGKKVSLHFVGEGPPLLSGSKVKVKGVKIGDKVAIASSKSEDFQVISEKTNVLPTATVRKVAVILINFQDDTSEPWSLDQIRSDTFTGTRSVNAYFQEASFGRFSLEGDVLGWYTIPYNRFPCNPYPWDVAARQAATEAGVDLTKYNNFVFAWPTSDCGWGGLANLGHNWSYINGWSTGTVAHEFGHNLGAHHSSSYNCTDSEGQRVPISNNCTVGEYGDPFDVMGSGVVNLRHMNNFQKGRVGWYEASNTQTIDYDADGTYTVKPIEIPSSGVLALRVESAPYYYLEYRQPFGFDNYSPEVPVVNGVTIRMAPIYEVIERPLLIDTTPATTTFSDSPLLVGQTFIDPMRNITIKTVSKSSDSARVEVSFGTVPCIRANPSISISPESQWGRAGETLAYTVSLINNDTSACGASTFDIASALLAGFSMNPSSFSESLSPGALTTKQINVTSSASTPDGFYTFSLTATKRSDPTYKKTATANYNVFTQDTTNPTVSVTFPASGATLSGAVVVQATATDDIGVTKVEFLVDGAVLVTDTSSPYSYLWNTVTVSNGIHTLTAKAYDAASNVGTSSPVTVTVNNSTCTRTNPTVDLTPATKSGAAGSSLDYTFNVTNNDNSACGNSTFSLSSTIPAGWSSTFTPSSLTLAPGANSSSTFRVTSSATATPGNYNASAKATNSSATSYNASDTSTYQVIAGPKPGDFNSDNRVDMLDFGKLVHFWGTSEPSCDANGDNVVDIQDYGAIAANWEG